MLSMSRGLQISPALGVDSLSVGDLFMHAFVLHASFLL